MFLFRTDDNVLCSSRLSAYCGVATSSEFSVSTSCYCLQVSCILAFVIYETLVTMDLEAQYFWAGDLTGAKVLFLVNRYYALFYCANLLVALWPSPHQVSRMSPKSLTNLLTFL